MEAFTHLSVMKGIGNRHDAHALMVGHETAHDGKRLACLEARGREIECLIESMATQCAQLSKAREIAMRGEGLDHRGQPGRVGRDDQVR